MIQGSELFYCHKAVGFLNKNEVRMRQLRWCAMAKTSRKRKEEQGAGGKRFLAGIYVRLSVEADARKNESIDTQIALAKEYIKEHKEIELFDCYIDLGKTGTHFKREGFERMMEDVRKNRIDCIIVKDLSRFGRNHIETGNYIQKIFPFMGVRFIAVSDGIDTYQMGEKTDELTMNLKNLLNEMYAKDIAAKVKSSVQIRREQGNYTGGIPPYGYIAKWKNGKKKLLIYKEAAKVVQDIYRMYLSGKGLKRIIEELYILKIHRPSTYRKTGHVFCRNGELLEQWTSATVKWILTNSVYMGRDCYTQDAIVSESIFFQTAARLENAAKRCCEQKERFKKMPVREDIFGGILYCGDCGKRMGKAVSVKKLCSGEVVSNYSYYCPDSKRLDALKCPSKSIGASALEKLVKNALQREFVLAGEHRKRLEEKRKRQTEDMENKFRWEITKCDRKLENRKRQDSEEYLKYYMGEISLQEYQKRKKENRDWMDEILERKESIKRQYHNMKREAVAEEEALKGIMEGREAFVLTKEILQILIKRIAVYQNHQIKIDLEE